jgi:hypothetical protein
MDSSGRRARLRSFVLGGVVGAAGAIATARRLRRASGDRASPPVGLAAFEDAPCFLEAVGGAGGPPAQSESPVRAPAEE